MLPRKNVGRKTILMKGEWAIINEWWVVFERSAAVD